MIEQLFPLGMAQYLVGGFLVGVGIVIPFLLVGLVAGASTVFTSTWSYISEKSFFQSPTFLATRHWRLALTAGFVTGGLLFTTFILKEPVVTTIEPWRLFLGGIIIGVGTRMSGGCASGHGVCGNASLHLPSFIATITFLLVAIMTAQLTITLF